MEGQAPETEFASVPPHPSDSACRGDEVVQWSATDQAFVVAGHAVARELLKDRRLILGEVAATVARLSSRMVDGPLSNLSLLVGTSHPFQNDPAHAPSRAWFREMLSSLSSQWTEERVAQWIDDRLAALGEDARADAVQLVAEALPESVVADAMGLAPAEVHRIGILSRRMSELWAARVHAVRELRLMEAAAAELVEMMGEKAGPAVRREDYARLVFLVSAGVETTAGALASGLDTLARNPSLQADLRRQPDLVTGFAEEILRLHPPLRRNVARVATEDIVVGGTTIPAGARIIIDIEKANRDATAFAQPDALDPARAGPPHLAFGGGVHACVGAALARVELRAAFARIVATFEINPAGGPRLRESRTFRQYDTLPLRFMRVSR
ncbi:cytochrome P450 [Reyranella sp.]|uniref:cytochrome P450 n=1 Tax=Reyranella sp. TaxID=1929291 RepID=UPI003BAD6EB6